MQAFTDLERQHRAQEAKRLRSEPLLKEYMQSARDLALETLATVDPSQTNEILRQQAIAQVAAEFSDYLDAVIAQGGDMDGGSDAPG